MKFEKWASSSSNQNQVKLVTQQPVVENNNNNNNKTRTNSDILRDILSFPPSRIDASEIPKLVDQLENAQALRSQNWFRLLEAKRNLVLVAAELQNLHNNNNFSEKAEEELLEKIRHLRQECESLHAQVRNQDSQMNELRSRMEVMTSSDAHHLTEEEQDTQKYGQPTKEFQQQIGNNNNNNKNNNLRSFSTSVSVNNLGVASTARRTNATSPEHKQFHRTMNQVIENSTKRSLISHHNKELQFVPAASEQHSSSISPTKGGRRQILIKPKQRGGIDDSSDEDDEGSQQHKQEKRKSAFDLGAIASLTAARVARKNSFVSDDDAFMLAAGAQNNTNSSGEFNNAASGSFQRTRSMNALERHKSLHNIQHTNYSGSGAVPSTLAKIPLQDFLFMCIKGAAKLQVRPDAIRAAEMIIKVQAKFRQRRIQKKFFMLRRLRRMFDRDCVSRCFYLWRNEAQATQSANNILKRRTFRRWNSAVSESVMKKHHFGFIWRGLRDSATKERVFKCWFRYIRYLDTKSNSEGYRRIAFTSGKNNNVEAWNDFIAKEDERRKLYKARSGIKSFLSFKKKRDDVDEETEDWLCKKKHWDTWTEYVEDARKIVQQELMAEQFINRRTLRKHFSAWEQLAVFTHQADRRDYATKLLHWTRWKRFVYQEKLERGGVQDFQRVHKLQHLTKWRRRAIVARRKTASHTTVLQNNRKLTLMVAYAWKGMTTHLAFLECWKEWVSYVERRRVWKAFVSSRVAVHNHFLKGAVFAAWALEIPSLAQKFALSKNHKSEAINLIAGEERLSDFTEELKSHQFKVRASTLMKRIACIESNARNQLLHFSQSITNFRNDEMMKKQEESKQNNSNRNGASGIAEIISNSARNNNNNNKIINIDGNEDDTAKNIAAIAAGKDPKEEDHNSGYIIPTSSKLVPAAIARREERRLENVMQTCIATARSGTAFMNPFDHHMDMWSIAEIENDRRNVNANFEWWSSTGSVQDRSLSFAVLHLLVDYVYRNWILPRKKQRQAAQRMIVASRGGGGGNVASISSPLSPSRTIGGGGGGASFSPSPTSIGGYASFASSMSMTIGERKQQIAQQQQLVAKRLVFAVAVISSVGMPFVQLGPQQKGAFMSVGNLEHFITSQSRTIQTRRIKEGRNQERRLKKFFSKQAALKLFQCSHTFSLSSLRQVLTPYRLLMEGAKKSPNGKKKIVQMPKNVSTAKQHIFALRRRLLSHPAVTDGEGNDDGNNNNIVNSKEANSLIGTRGIVHCDFHRFVELQVARGCALRDLAYLGVNTTMYGFTGLKPENIQRREFQLSTLLPLEQEMTLSTDRIKKRIHDVAPRPIFNPVNVDFRLMEVVGFTPNVFNLRSLLRLRERMRLQEEEKKEVYAKAEAAIAARNNRQNVDDIFSTSYNKKDDPNAASHLQQLSMQSQHAHSFTAMSLKAAAAAGSFLGSRHGGAAGTKNDFRKFMAGRGKFNPDQHGDENDEFYNPQVAAPIVILGNDPKDFTRSGGKMFSTNLMNNNSNKIRGQFLVRRKSATRRTLELDAAAKKKIPKFNENGEEILESEGDDDGEEGEEGEFVDAEEMERRKLEEEWENRPEWMKIEADEDPSVVFDDYQRMAPRTWRLGATSLQKRNQIRKDDLRAAEDDEFGDEFENDDLDHNNNNNNNYSKLDFVDRWVADPTASEMEELLEDARRNQQNDNTTKKSRTTDNDYVDESEAGNLHARFLHPTIERAKGQVILREVRVSCPFYKKIRERMSYDAQCIFVAPMPTLLAKNRRVSVTGTDRESAMPKFDDDAFNAIEQVLKEKQEKERLARIDKEMLQISAKLLQQHAKARTEEEKMEDQHRARLIKMELTERVQQLQNEQLQKELDRIHSIMSQLEEKQEPFARDRVEKIEDGERKRILGIEKDFRRERLRLEQEEAQKVQNELLKQDSDGDVALRPGSSASSRKNRPESANNIDNRSVTSSSRKSVITTTDENGNEIQIAIDQHEDEEEDDDEEANGSKSATGRSSSASRMSHHSKLPSQLVTPRSRPLSALQQQAKRPGSGGSVLQGMSVEDEEEEEKNINEIEHHEQDEEEPPLVGSDEESAEDEEYYEEFEEEYEEEVEVVNDDGSITTVRTNRTRKTGRSTTRSKSQTTPKGDGAKAKKINDTARTATISTLSSTRGETARKKQQEQAAKEAAEKELRRKKKKISFMLKETATASEGEEGGLKDHEMNIAAKILRHASNVRGAFSADNSFGGFSVGSGIGDQDSDDEEKEDEKEEDMFDIEFEDIEYEEEIEVDEEIFDAATGLFKRIKTKKIVKKWKKVPTAASQKLLDERREAKLNKKKNKKKVHRISYANAAKALEQFQKEMRELLPQRVIAPRPQIVLFDDSDDYETDDEEDEDESDTCENKTVNMTDSARKKRKLKSIQQKNREKQKYKPHVIAKELMLQPDPRVFIDRPKDTDTPRRKRTNILLQIQKDRHRMLRGNAANVMSIPSPFQAKMHGGGGRKLTEKEEQELYAVFQVNPETGLLEQKVAKPSSSSTTAAGKENINTSSIISSSSPANLDSTLPPSQQQHQIRPSVSPSRRSLSPQNESPTAINSCNNNKKLVRATQIAMELEGRRSLIASYEAGTYIRDIVEDIHRFFEHEKTKKKEWKKQLKLDQEARREARKNVTQDSGENPIIEVHQDETEERDDNEQTEIPVQIDSDEDEDDEHCVRQPSSRKPYSHLYPEIPRLLPETGKNDHDQKGKQPFVSTSSSITGEMSSSVAAILSTTNVNIANNITARSAVSSSSASARHHQRPNSAPALQAQAKSEVTSARNENNNSNRDNTEFSPGNLPPRPPSAPNGTSSPTSRNNNPSFITASSPPIDEQQNASPINQKHFGALSQRDITVIRTLERRNMRRQIGQPVLSSLTRSILSPNSHAEGNQQQQRVAYTSSLLGNRRLAEKNMFTLFDNRGTSIQVPKMYTGGNDEYGDDEKKAENTKKNGRNDDEHEDEEEEEEVEIEIEVTDHDDDEAESERESCREPIVPQEESENPTSLQDSVLTPSSRTATDVDHNESARSMNDEPKPKKTKIIKRKIIKTVMKPKRKKPPTHDEKLLEGAKEVLKQQQQQLRLQQDPQRAKVRENLDKMLSTANLINQHLARMK